MESSLLYPYSHNVSGTSTVQLVINGFSGWTDKVFNAELDFVIENIKFAMDNESCWNYLRAILEHDLLKETKGTIYYNCSNI